jgi:dimethylhistidine N-methyltransferase
MTQTAAPLAPLPTSAFQDDVLAGLARQPKSLPCKYFYDEHGSELFARICQLEVYYPTRTELAIMKIHSGEMASLIGRRARLVELGSGSSTKTRVLLDRLADLDSYVPVDISADYLARAASALARDYPHIAIVPIAADYSLPFELPRSHGATRTVVYFPGSTIGNLVPADARRFLKVIAGVAGPRGGLLIGVDLKKDPRVLHAAYNDPEGVTAAFNSNLLVRINRELGADFDLRRFRHEAFYDGRQGRIEMQLVSLATQIVRVGRSSFSFGQGEPITTEYSYKYDLGEFQRLAASAGFGLRRVWTDEELLFSVQYYGVDRASCTGLR